MFNIYLSEKDEFVPSSYIGMYSIFRNPKNKSVYLSEESCQKIRKRTFEKVRLLYEKYGASKFSDFFNYNLDILDKIGVNYFASHPGIAPISKIIECFESNKGTEKHPQYMISFAIEKYNLSKYFERKRIAENTNTEFRNPKLNRYNDKRKDFVLLGNKEFQVYKDKSVKIPLNALYNQFSEWCELQDISEEDGVLMALEELIKAHPLDKLKEITDYDFLTEFDKLLFARPKHELEYVEKTVDVSGGIFALSDMIIERYNRDPQNITKQIDFNKYVNNALHLLNNSMPLIYRDPELYVEQQKINEMIEYNRINEE